MANFKIHKVVGNLPDPLEADTVYLVRVGEGFDLYASDGTGNIAHQINYPETFVTLTQAAYDALDPPDPNVIYAIPKV